ncbi:hypothetical protein [Pelomonas cellulosilytica]|uniref:Transcriptional regulator n=1 Tax=Pelomonas cellulosilytica TaxID=2906762 RepID=A0ABS8Y0T3_9BURK|nr:hypothetical protein [Pelomonas sp. P8]MCE4557170.1 hypothetical protein [Pelomonas sp. P8]
MRDAICRWAEAEMKQLLAGAAETRRQKAQEHKEAKPVMKRQSESPAPAAEQPRKRAA